MGDFKVSYYQLISENQLVIKTTLEFVAFDTGIRGTATEIQKTNFHNFLLSFYPNKREMTVHSELYSNTDEKFQKEDFTKRIFNLSLS